MRHSTSACLTYPVVSALADGYEVAFIEDAVGDSSKRQHDTQYSDLPMRELYRTQRLE